MSSCNYLITWCLVLRKSPLTSKVIIIIIAVYPLIHVLALNNSPKSIRNLSQSHTGQLLGVHARNVPIPNSILGNNHIIPKSCAISSRS